MTDNINVLSYYLDSLVTEMVLSHEGLSKHAQAGDMLSGITGAVQNYFGSKVDRNDRAGSFLNMIAPGAVTAMFMALNMTGIGLLFGLAMNFFNIDVKGILGSIYTKMKELFGGGKAATPEQVDAAVQSAVQEHSAPATPEEATKAEQFAEQHKGASQILRDARVVKLAIIELDRIGLTKLAQSRRAPQQSSISDFFSSFSGKKLQTTSTLTRVLSWIFRIAALSAGLMVGADLLKKFLGMDNSLDGSVKDGKPTGAHSGGAPASGGGSPLHVATQTKFKPLPGGTATHPGVWQEGVSNDRPSIESMIINFAKESYQGLDGLDNVIKSTPGFQVVAERIENYNSAAAGNASVIIPEYFPTKKSIVDLFIDDVAAKTK